MNGLSLKQRAIGAYSAPWLQRLVLAGMRISGREARFLARYMGQPGPKALQIGAGANRHRGWLHTNHFPIRPWGRQSVFLDATARFPFACASFDYVFAEHMIEHVDYAGGAAMLREAFRVLKPGGRIRIATPDVRVFARLLGEDLSAEDRALLGYVCEAWNAPGEPVSGVAALNTQMHAWGHRFLYDEAALRGSIEKAGFTHIRRMRVGESADPFLAGIDNDARLPSGVLDAISVVLEAVKPGGHENPLFSPPLRD